MDRWIYLFYRAKVTILVYIHDFCDWHTYPVPKIILNPDLVSTFIFTAAHIFYVTEIHGPTSVETAPDVWELEEIFLVNTHDDMMTHDFTLFWQCIRACKYYLLTGTLGTLFKILGSKSWRLQFSISYAPYTRFSLNSIEYGSFSADLLVFQW